MENEFTKVMSQRTDDELIMILTADRENYNSDAINAAETEIEKRKIDKNVFDEIKNEVTVEKEKKKEVDENVVSSFTRFLNFLIDNIVWYIFGFIIVIIVRLIVQPQNDETHQIINLLSMAFAFFAYYIFMENKFQKTVGKYITKTKIVKINGEKPESSDILTRTFCRLIPFDRISYLFVKNGFHDMLSKTKVVRDKLTNKEMK